MNRILWAILLVGGLSVGFCVSRFGQLVVQDGWLMFAPLLIALLPFVGLIRWVGWSRAVVACLMLGGFFLLIASVATLTGYPFGEFHFSDRLGLRAFGLVPWTIPFAGVGLTLGILPIASRWGRRLGWRFAWSGLWMAALGLLAEGVASLFSLWQYQHVTLIRGTPISSLGGWTLTGLVGGILAFLLIPQDAKQAPSLIVAGLTMALGFWTGVAVDAGFWGTAALGMGLAYGLWRTVEGLGIGRRLMPK